jgi:membrane protein DedA with SNARE-associated domain
MTLASFVQQYGYLALALGAFLEGETVVIAAGLAAYHGHLTMPLVIAIAATASFLGDQPYFYAGRLYGPSLLVRFPSLNTRKERIDNLIARHHVMLVPSLRFLYGLRIVGLVMIGMSNIGVIPFQLLNMFSAMVWAVAFAFIGYATGYGIHILGASSDVTQIIVVATVLLSCTIAYAVLQRRKNDPD